MTEQEVISCLKADKEYLVDMNVCDGEEMDVAIKALEEVQKYREIGTVEKVREYKEIADNMDAVSMAALCVSLNKLKEYQKIGTPEECRSAIEKQKSKKPDFEGDGYADGHLVYDTWICPCCGKHYEVDYDDYDFCPNCGQKLDWEGGGVNA